MDFNKTAARLGSALDATELTKAVPDFHLGDALAWIGLERKPSLSSQILPAIGLITVSAAIGQQSRCFWRPARAGSYARASRTDSPTPSIA